jgi:hypothetical protein
MNTQTTRQPISRLFGFPATVADSAPGLLGRGGIAGVMIFDAGSDLYARDLMARFWADEASVLDWLDNFLCDPKTDILVRQPEGFELEEEFEEVEYYKSELTTLGSEEIV